MDEEEVCFPLNSIGYWHNGVHIINEEFVIQKYLAFVCAVRNSDFLLDKNNDLYEMITESEYKLLSDEEKEMYSSKGNNPYYELKGSLKNSLIKQILKKLNLYSSQDFVLFQHKYYNDKNSEKLHFFSLYMHLDQVLDTKCSKDIEYSNADNPKIIFPHSTFAKAGTSEKDDIIYQLEYFMDKKNAADFFNNNQLFISANECYKIDGEIQLFSLNSQNEIIKRSYLRNTIFEVTEFPDEEKYPNIARVKPYLLPCTIYKDNNIFLQKKADLDFRFALKDLIQIKLFELNSKAKIHYLLNNEFISKAQVEFIEKFHHLKIESINNIEYQKEISLRDLICGFDSPGLSEFKTCFINNHALNFDKNEFYIDLNSSPLKEVYFDKKRMLLLTTNINLETMKYNPCLYEAIPKNKIVIGNSLKIPCNKIYFNNDNIKYGLNGKTYFRYLDNLYYCLDTKKEIHISQNDYFTFVSYDDLKILDKEIDIQKKKEKLREIFDEETEMKNKNYIEGAFEHPSEWHSDDSVYKGLGYKQKYIKKNLAIWDSNYLNKSLPDGIRDCRNLTFFHKTQFEAFLSALHRAYADKLIRIQDMVMHKYSYKQGNLGLYEAAFGFKSSSNQTFCNHAVYETIKHVDGNYFSFLMGIDEPPWDTRKYKCIHTKENKHDNECENKKQFFSFLTNHNNLEKNNYKYKPSNLWCDVLEYQAERSGKTGIYKITAEQAFYMAQLGYVVIAAWKNLTPKGNDPNINYSPHFVTVSPVGFMERFNKYDCPEVAHVGGGENRRLPVFDAFSTEYGEEKANEIYFYCNLKQKFI